MRWFKWLSAGAAVTLVAVVVTAAVRGQNGYDLEVLMPAADGTYEGGRVSIAGEVVGEVTDVGVRGDQALVAVRIDEKHAPLHAGTTARVNWQSLIGDRVVEIIPGAEDNPTLPSGKRIESEIERVELGDVLSALDEPTRKHLQGLLNQLNETFDGRENDVNATLKAAGPAIGALGEVMRAVGEDGPAIRDLVERLQDMTSELAARDTELRETIGNLGRLTSSTVEKQEQLGETFAELPSTVQEATATLRDVPAAVDEAKPLLREIRPATQQLPAVAGNLNPVLDEVGPAVSSLKPTLRSAGTLLQETPDLLDGAHATLPDVTEAASELQPAVAFLRPYTPEAVGWLSNWAGVWGSRTESGSYARPLITSSASAFNDNPGVLAPGLKQDPRPAPGSPAGQPWTDANGDGIR
ncbi:MCE family protein [Haloechinothrix sp. YIM 98757]|uniref:MCE family protein n=1 Tax=Haloechinothrix aidingensis TaxID=2752311 RepID=A0A838AC62_9PSEU|nr:MlaD family protein [Haloechinothrix aidingensis]MBA0126775.1 MCE family protein [Haloechinothrix aidingensis]